MSDALGFEVELPIEYDAATEQARSALRAEGFGILTEIDLKATFREKLGHEFRRYTILGACNPPLAWTAINADPRVGLLLPCNVTVEESAPGRSVVRLVDPQALLAAAPGGLTPELRDVAADARARIERVASALSSLAREGISAGSEDA